MRLTVVLFGLMLGGCFFPKAGPPPDPLSELKVTLAKARWPDASAESLERGRQYFLGTCDNCHKYPDLPHYSEEKWPPIMQRMGKKAELTPEETELVLRFILAHRTQPATTQR